MHLSIIIVNYNSSDVLSECIESIERSDIGCPFEIVIVNNNRDDRLTHLFPANSRNIRLIEGHGNVGFAKACNLGIEESSGRYILLLNPDAMLQKGAVSKMIDFMARHKDCGCVGPKIIRFDGSIQLEGGRDFPSLKYLFFEIFLLRRLFPAVFGGWRLERWGHDTNREVPCLLGASMLFSRRLITELGLLDTALPMYLEDMDLCYRIKKSGKMNYYLADAVVRHKAAHSSRDILGPGRINLYVMELCQANYLFFIKHRSRVYAEAYRGLIFLGAAFRVVLIFFGIIFFYLAGKRPKDFSNVTLKKYAAFFRWSLHPAVSRLSGEP